MRLYRHQLRILLIRDSIPLQLQYRRGSVMKACADYDRGIELPRRFFLLYRNAIGMPIKKQRD